MQSNRSLRKSRLLACCRGPFLNPLRGEGFAQRLLHWLSAIRAEGRAIVTAFGISVAEVLILKPELAARAVIQISLHDCLTGTIVEALAVQFRI